jgi:molecular chaperone GrpE
MNQKREKNEVEPDTEAVDEATIREDCTEFQDDDAIEPDEPENREEELELKISELKDQLLRAVADSENIRKRSEREKDQTRKFGIANFAKDLLSIADNLGRALDAAPKNEDIKDDAIKNFVIGIQMTEQELQKAFDNNNIRKIDPIGEKFDYNFHQAMFEVEETDQEPGVVVQVLQPGYAIDDRILRPAMVGVSKAKDDKKSAGVDTTA